MNETDFPLTGLPEADAGRRNMALLIQLRWLAVGGQLLTIFAVRMAMDIRPPLPPLLGAIAILVAINIISLLLLQRGRAVLRDDRLGVAGRPAADVGQRLLEAVDDPGGDVQRVVLV